MNNFNAVNDIYKQYFKEDLPARSCVGIQALPKGAKVELECVAVVPRP